MKSSPPTITVALLSVPVPITSDDWGEDRYGICEGYSENAKREKS